MGDLVAYPPGRPVWLGKVKSRMTPEELADSEAFDLYLLAMHSQGWRYQELASRHNIAVRTVWSRAQGAREVARRASAKLEAKSAVERVLREMIAKQQAQLAAQAGRIAELARQSRRLLAAERAVAALQTENARLRAQLASEPSAERPELKVAS